MNLKVVQKQNLITQRENWYKSAREEWDDLTEDHRLVRYMGTILAEVWVMPGENEYENVASMLAILSAKIERSEGIKLTPQGDYEKVG
jgi:hypothetical protein